MIIYNLKMDRKTLFNLAKLENEDSYKFNLEEYTFFKELSDRIDVSKKFDEEDKEDLYYNLIEAFKNERQKYYEDSADYYIKVYEKFKEKDHLLTPSIMLGKKFLKLKYLEAKKYNDEKDYSTAIDKLKEFIDINHNIVKSLGMFYWDWKKDCRELLLVCLYDLGIHEYKDKNYSYSLQLLEEALKIKRKWFNEYADVYYNVNYWLSKVYEKLAKEYWNNNDIYYMEKSIDYLNKSKNLNRPLSIQKNLELYYYLYKAYYESNSYRISNLENAKKFEENGINVTDLYNKSKHISDLEYDISIKQNNISNLNYELNSINNNINNIQSKINAKNIVISNKNTAIRELNNLADALTKKGKEINSQANESINETKNQANEIKKNVQEKKDFVKEIKEFENQKENEIKNMKNNNISLKQKNEQLILMLNTLESKLF